MFGTILTVLLGGIVIGVLGKLVAPGDRDNIPFWLVIVCGIGGMLIGTYLYGAIWGTTDTKGIDWWRHIWQIVVAAALVVGAAAVTGRAKTRA